MRLLSRGPTERPNSDEILRALVGGEIELPNGKSRLVQGSVTLRQEPTLSPVAAR